MQAHVIDFKSISITFGQFWGPIQLSCQKCMYTTCFPGGGKDRGGRQGAGKDGLEADAAAGQDPGVHQEDQGLGLAAHRRLQQVQEHVAEAALQAGGFVYSLICQLFVYCLSCQLFVYFLTFLSAA